MEVKEGKKLLQGGSRNKEVVKSGHEPRQCGSQVCGQQSWTAGHAVRMKQGEFQLLPHLEHRRAGFKLSARGLCAEGLIRIWAVLRVFPWGGNLQAGWS